MNGQLGQWIKYNNNFSTGNMAPILPPLLHFNTISEQYFIPQNASLLPFNLSLPLLWQALKNEDSYRDRIRVDPQFTENETWIPEKKYDSFVNSDDRTQAKFVEKNKPHLWEHQSLATTPQGKASPIRLFSLESEPKQFFTDKKDTDSQM